jgi:hypothetical protein
MPVAWQKMSFLVLGILIVCAILVSQVWSLTLFRSLL